VASTLAEGLVKALRITTPIYLIEGRDVAIFETVEDAQAELEPVLVRRQSDVGFDATGRPLVIESDARTVLISLNESAKADPQALAERLRRYLVAIGEKRAGEEECDLPCLVELSRAHAVRTHSNRL
jgi:hypothetical protein